MWNKTFAGLLCGIVFVIFAPSGIALMLKQHLSLVLGLTVLFGLTGWAGIMTWCYGAQSGKQAWLRGAYCALPSIAIYAFAFFVFGAP